jgi:tetratricopeptide (TPR) repeat protein
LRNPSGDVPGQADESERKVERAAPKIFRRGPELYGAVLALVVLCAIGFLPQFGGPGYEAALAAGLVLPAVASVSSALAAVQAKRPPFEAFARGLFAGTVLGALGLLVLLAHGLRAGFCDPFEGVTLYALGPWIGAVLGGGWGGLSGLVAERIARPRLRRAATVTLALSGPIGGIAISVWRFYTSPMVFAFDPFVGYFSGPLYDTVIDGVGSLLSYRVGSVATLLGVSAVLLHLERTDTGLRFRWLGRPGLALAGFVALATSLSVTLNGPALGHWHTATSIERALGRKLSVGRCDVVYSRGILARDAALAGRDCDRHLARVERYFEIDGKNERVRLYLFANDAEKGALMGASNTYIAKPWRREVYLQYAPYPHPVLGHEIAHVVAGSFGVGPFRVAGPLGGLIPDPGRIEGVAVAASPNENDDFLLDEWARALQDLGLLPELRGIFRLGFLGENSSTAYTVAGAFVSWFKEKFGAQALRRWYAGAALPELTQGKDIDALDRDFRKQLATRPIDPKLLAVARARFDRPAIFGRRCPRVVDRLAQEAAGLLGASDTAAARDAYEDVLRLDPKNAGAKLGLAACSLKAGDEALALKSYDQLSRARELSKLEQAAALETKGDIALAAGRLDDARAAYDAVAAIVVDEDRLRTLDVKRFAIDHEPGRRAIVALLIGDSVYGPSWDVAAPLLAEWQLLEPEQSLPPYLLGKNLYGHGRPVEAAGYLGRAVGASHALPRVLRETQRMRLIASCALGDQRDAQNAFKALIDDPELVPARKAGLRSLAERCGVSPRE